MFKFYAVWTVQYFCFQNWLPTTCHAQNKSHICFVPSLQQVGLPASSWVSQYILVVKADHM